MTPKLMTYIITLLTFLGIVSTVYAGFRFYATYKIKRRLAGVADSRKVRAAARLDTEEISGTRASALITSLSRLSLPEEGWQDSNLRLRFIRAGFRKASAPQMYFAVKSGVTFGVPLVVAAMVWAFGLASTGLDILLYALISMIMAYFIPDLYLKWRTAQRADDIQRALPDLMDLMVICVEAGLGLEAALNRISKDIDRTSASLAEELYLTTLEIRAGSGRIDALRNMALRIDLEDVNGLVVMLVQSDKFGTSLADALRVHAENTRIRRAQRAEEHAAKIPVKILFPLVLFIFPALMIVLGGPAVIRLAQTL